MHSLINNFRTWHSSLAPIQKVGVAGVAITAALLGARGVSLAYNKYINPPEDADKNNNSDKQNVNKDGIDVTDPAKSSYLYRLKRLSFNPVFYGSYFLTTLCWTFTLKPSIFDKLPRIYEFGKTKTLQELLHPVPKSLSQAFALGQLEKELTLNEESGKIGSIIDDILTKASKLLNRDIVTQMLSSQQLHAMKSEIVKSENERSLANRAKSVLNFVNVMWLFSIMGISATVIPVVYYTLKPFQEYFIRFGKWLKEILVNKTAFRIYEVCHKEIKTFITTDGCLLCCLVFLFCFIFVCL